MTELPTTHQTLPFQNTSAIPAADLVFSACRFSPEGFFFDRIDFKKQVVDRWSIPHLPLPDVAGYLEQNLPADKVPGGQTREQWLKSLHRPHVCQLSEDLSSMLVCMEAGAYALRLDCREHQAFLYPTDWEAPLCMYNATGDFSKDGRAWYFIRWPFVEAVEYLSGRRASVNCQIGRASMDDYSSSIIHEVDYIDDIHQITCSDDERYLVFTTFKMEPVLPYPCVPMEDDTEGWRACHMAGIRKQSMVTVDLATGRNWRTPIPVPVPGHFEFDPVHPDVLYVSAHNFVAKPNGDIILEGPASLLKMRIRDGETVVEDAHTGPDFFRITQHTPFRFQGRTLIAVTTIPNKLDIIDAETMTRWRRVELFPHAPIDFSRTGNAMCPKHPEMCLSVNPSRDGRHIVLESHRHFVIYDVENDILLPDRLSSLLGEGCGRIGHCRLAGR